MNPSRSACTTSKTTSSTAWGAARRAAMLLRERRDYACSEKNREEHV